MRHFLTRSILGLAAAALLLCGGCAEKHDPLEIDLPEKGGSPSGSSPMESEVDTEDDAYIGLPLEEARALAEERELPHRVTREDGESLPATTDFRPERLNFQVEDGEVVGVSRG